MTEHRIPPQADFALLWVAETIGQVGMQITVLGLPLAAIMILKATPLEVGALRALEWLPFLLISLLVGIWVDRRRRRPILIAGNIGRACILLAIPLAFALGALSLWQLYSVAFLAGILSVFFDVASQSYLPSLIARDQLVRGNALLEASRSGAGIVGPSIAGALIGFLTAPMAIVVNVLGFLMSAVLLGCIRRDEPEPDRRVNKAGRLSLMRDEIIDGLRYVRRQRTLRAIAAFSAASNLGFSLVESIFLIYAVRQLRLNVGEIGLMYAVGNIGLLAGAVFAGPLAVRIGLGRTLIVSSGLQGLSLVPVPLAALASPLLLLITGQLLRTCGVVLFNVTAASLRQAMTPDHLRGRMNATMRFVGWGIIPVGSVLGGVVATLASVQVTLWIGAIAGLLAIVPVALSPLRTIHHLPSLTEG